jgi:ketosteroid isomerase-like protein
MSSQNVEILERMYDAFNRGDIAAALEHFDPAIEWRVAPEAGPSTSTYHGHQGVYDAIGSLYEVWDGYHIEPQRFWETGDLVVVSVRAHGRGRASGAEVDAELAHLWQIRDRKVVRFEAHADFEHAARRQEGDWPVEPAPFRAAIAPDVATADLPIGSVFAGHRIEEAIGKGGMGIVYRATELRLDRQVALKLVAPEAAGDSAIRERFRQEAALTAQLDHPNVVPMYEAGEADGVLYMTMRWVEGTSLRDLIDRGGPLDPGRATALIARVAAALDAAHANGLIHRDVKPSNVLVTSSDHVYLTDFGLTRRTDPRVTPLTRPGQLVGTVDYMAPEQIEGGPVDPRTDVYSLGCMLYEAVTGQPPFRRDNALATLRAQLQDPAPSATDQASNVPPMLADVMQRAIAKQPADRCPSAGSFGAASLAAAGAEALLR